MLSDIKSNFIKKRNAYLYSQQELERLATFRQEFIDIALSDKKKHDIFVFRSKFIDKYGNCSRLDKFIEIGKTSI